MKRPVEDGRAAEDTERPGLARSNARRRAWLGASIVLLLVVVLGSMTIGAKAIPLEDVWGGLLDFDAANNDHVIVRDLRLPRTILGLLVGMALGVSGALMQALTRNPLADPGILGVNAGAGFAMVLAVEFLGAATLDQYIWFSFVGAVVVTVAVYILASLGGTPTPITLALAGIALGAALTGISSGITLLSPTTFDRLRFWDAGALADRPMETVLTVLPFIVVGLVIAVTVTKSLNAIALGDDVAKALGARIGVTRAGVTLSVTLLCGAATAAAGPIGFVGLMIPHVARWYVGPDQRWIVAYTLVLSPTLLLVADIVGRVVLRPDELQVGIVTAFIGAPVLVWLVRRRDVSGL